MFERIRAYHWPGNIRELNSVMESYLILLGSRGSDERLFLELFEEYGDPAGPPVSQPQMATDATLSPAAGGHGDQNDSRTLAEQMEAYKRSLIRQTLHRCGNNKTLAAKKLGISTNTLWRALKRGQGLFA
jgi:propionate catabolism operon transcriptional regulator